MSSTTLSPKNGVCTLCLITLANVEHIINANVTQNHLFTVSVYQRCCFHDHLEVVLLKWWDAGQHSMYLQFNVFSEVQQRPSLMREAVWFIEGLWTNYHSVIIIIFIRWRDSLVVCMLDQRPRGCRFESSWPWDGHVATVGQLLFAPWAWAWAWAYSTIHPFGVSKWVPATAGKV